MAGGVNAVGNLQGKVNANNALVVTLDGGAANATTVTATEAVVIGTADTDGIRLDLESGSLAVREGDDSGYGDVKADDGTFNGLLFGTNIVSSAGGYIHNTLRSGFTSPVDGTFRIQNWAFDNYLDVLNETWGSKLSAESVSVADSGTLNLGAAPLGLLTITVGTDNIVGRFQLRGSSNAVVADDGNNAIFTTTKDTATSINVYFDTNAYFIQNTRGGARSVRVLLTGA